MKKGFTHVYTAKIPDKIGSTCEIYPALRREYIESAANDEVRRSRYYAWRLLEHALRESLGVDISEVKLSRNEGGAWHCPLCRFSISHTDGYVAVAISDSPVGVDIEPIRELSAKSFAKRIMTESELSEYSSLPHAERTAYLIKTWSAKEAIFKSLGESAFLPQKIDTGNYIHTEKGLSYPEGELVLAIAHGENTRLEIYENIAI